MATVTLSISRTSVTTPSAPTARGRTRSPRASRRAGSSAGATAHGLSAGATRVKVSRPSSCSAAPCRAASTPTGPATPAVAVTVASLGVSAITFFVSDPVAGDVASEDAAPGKSTAPPTAAAVVRTGRTGPASTTGSVASSTSRRPIFSRRGTSGAARTISAGGPSVAGATYLGLTAARGGRSARAGTGSGASAICGPATCATTTSRATAIFRAGRARPTGTSLSITPATVSGRARSIFSLVTTGPGGRATTRAAGRAPIVSVVGAPASTAICTATGAGSGGST